jgi:hypothetical protein
MIDSEYGIRDTPPSIAQCLTLRFQPPQLMDLYFSLELPRLITPLLSGNWVLNGEILRGDEFDIGPSQPL